MSGQLVRLSAVVEEVLPSARLLPRLETDLEMRTAAAAIVRSRWPRAGEATGGLGFVAEVGIAMRERQELLVLRPGACRLVDETDVHSLPGAPPRLLQRAGIVEVARPEAGERIVGDLIGLAWTPRRDATLAVVLWTAEGFGGVWWRPVWGEEELPRPAPEDYESSIIGPPAAGPTLAHATAATRFLVVLGLLLEAQGAPVREERSTASTPREAKRSGQPLGWPTRHLYLADRPTHRAEPHGGAAGGPPGPDSELREVEVRGHIRSQPYGPGRTERRLIWIESHEARRWVRPGPRRTVVH